MLFILLYCLLLVYVPAAAPQEDIINNLLKQVIYLVICGVASIQIPRFAGIPFVAAFIAGQFVYNLIIVFYSNHVGYDSVGRLYGYGLLFNPITNDIMNSPQIGNNLSVATCFFGFLVFSDKSSLIVRMICLLSVVLAIPAGIFTGARSFVIISMVGLALVFFKLRFLSIQRILIPSILFALFVFLAVPYLFLHFDFNQSLSFFLQRLENTRMDEDSRTVLLFEGVDLLLSNPLGGFNSNNHLWFHNFFLDTARLGGFPLLLVVAGIFLKPVNEIVACFKNGFTLLPFLAFIAIIVLFQDVVVEGNMFPLFLTYIISLSMFNGQNSCV